MQHFLLSSEAVDLSAEDIASMSDAQVRRLVRQMRWPDTKGKPVCPTCNHDRIYEMASGRLKCAACRKLFSETSGTILHSHKLPLRTILMALFLWANGAKGVAALHMRRNLAVSYKSAFILLHKLREAIGDARAELKVGGVVEIDAAYVGGYVRPPNVGREGRRPTVKSRKQCVLTMVERGGSTVNLVVEGETTGAILAAVGKHVLPGSTNIAESNHSRLRRAEKGVHHRLSGQYLESYVREMAYRGDRRRRANGDVFREIGEMALTHPVSRISTGRWQARPGGKLEVREADIRQLMWTPLEPFEPWRWAA
jgi:transposase-like protein